jgi:hypothetical protein
VRRPTTQPRLRDIKDAKRQDKTAGQRIRCCTAAKRHLTSYRHNGDVLARESTRDTPGTTPQVVIWANHGANNRKRTTHDNYNGRQHRRPGCQHLSRRPQSPNQSCHDYLWMGDQESTSTSTTTPKNDLQKLASPHLRRHTSFWLPIEDTKDRPRGIHMTTFGRGIKITHQPLRLHQRAIYRSHLVLNYDDNQASYKSSQGFKFENCDLFHLHKDSRWS